MIGGHPYERGESLADVLGKVRGDAAFEVLLQVSVIASDPLGGFLHGKPVLGEFAAQEFANVGHEDDSIVGNSLHASRKSPLGDIGIVLYSLYMYGLAKTCAAEIEAFRGERL